MGEFAYVAPATVADTVVVLEEHASAGKRAQVLAGGTDLLVQMRGPDIEPRTIVDIKQLDETNRLELGADEIFIGAAIPSAETSPTVATAGAATRPATTPNRASRRAVTTPLATRLMRLRTAKKMPKNPASAASFV